MVASHLKNHERNVEAARSFDRKEQGRDGNLRSESVVQILDSLHIGTEEGNVSRPTVEPPSDSIVRARKNVVKQRPFAKDDNEASAGTSQFDFSRFGSKQRSRPRDLTPSEAESQASSDIEVQTGLLCRGNTLGTLFRNRGRSVHRAKEQLAKVPPERQDSTNTYRTPQRSSIKHQGTETAAAEVDVTGYPVPPLNIPDPAMVEAGDIRREAEESRRTASGNSSKDRGAPTPGDSSRPNMDEILTKIKRAVTQDLSNEIRPPLIHSFTNKLFAMRTPWQLPMKERSLRNNVQQVVSFYRVLERYVEDQVFRYGPALHPRLERVYNDFYVKVDQMFKKVSDKHMSQFDEPRRLAVVGNGVYDLGGHRSRGAPIYYQKFVVFDLAQETPTFANEHGDVFHRQVLNFPMNSRGLPSMRYLCSVASAALFWLDFYNRDNVVIFNYSALNYNLLLTFACVIIASQPLATANEVDHMITSSFDWRRKCQSVTKGLKRKPDTNTGVDLPQMIPIVRWPPSYKRYVSYFLSLYGAPIDFVIAQQFRLKRITLINCMLPGTEVMLEVYQVGPDASQAAAAQRWGEGERSKQCSRYAAAFFPKCACGGKERDGVVLIACSSDYKVLSKSTNSTSSKYGYVGEVIFDFKVDADGNRRNIIISGDITIALVAVTMKQRKVIATYSFNTGFVSSEVLEVPKAEFDIWDDSCAIQPHGQMTIAMESRQRHGADSWNASAPPIIIRPPMSDVGIFMRHHVAKVSATETQALVKATGLSYDTCKFALKLCPRYLDAVAILNTLFVPKKVKESLESTIMRGDTSPKSGLLTVESIDTPRLDAVGAEPLVGKPSAPGEAEASREPEGSRVSEELATKGSGSPLSATPSTQTDRDGAVGTVVDRDSALTVDQVERVVMDSDGMMQLLLVDGTKRPIPKNSITSLFQMFGTYQGTPTEAPKDAAPGMDGQAHSSAAVSTRSVAGAAGFLPHDGPVPGLSGPFPLAKPGLMPKAMPPPPSSVSTPPSPTTTLPKSVAPGKDVPLAKKAPEAKLQAVTSKAPPQPPKAKESVPKAAPFAVKKGPPCKMKAAPPPPIGKAKALVAKKPPPLGVKLHWKPLNTNTVKGTIFENLPKPSTETKIFDSSVAKQLFSKTAVKRQLTMKAPEIKRKMVLEILDAKRAQNIGIILRFAKESDLDDLIECLDTVTLDHPIVTLDNIFKIQSALPQGQELESFTAALQGGADITAYRDVEQKIFKIIKRQHMEQKARVIHFALNYKTLLEVVDGQIGVFQRANEQITANEFLPIVMGGILQYGNFVNHGDDSDVHTVGFSLSSASKLIDLKSADNALSSMHYLVVNLVVKFPDLDFAAFDRSLNHVFEAEKISASGVDEIFDEIRDGLNFLIRLDQQVPPESLLHRKNKELISESTAAIGVANERQKVVFDATRSIWRYLGEECKQGVSLEEIYRILADFTRCIKRVMADIQQRPSKFIVALNGGAEREIYTNKFSRARRR
ncbi:formin 2, putative [Babesia caballi]|uniref:Formin 2, putative n=1 Tax=Babesia caballi TaxID=5871 RepID=A0AAV4M0P1_BABCB|nr:formin 2, putative [Babesia caballi]